MRPCHRSIPKRPPRRLRRAFTLLEVMLAMILGSLVLITALGVFASLQRANRHNENRLRNASELSMTHRSVELALRSMILSTSRPPQPAPEIPATDPAAPQQPALPELPPEDEVAFERPRVILATDNSLPPMRWLDGQGRVVELEAQRLEITIERPPVFAQPRPGENYVPVVRRTYASRNQRDRDRRREERAAEREDIGSNQDSMTIEDSEPAIAAGVRGAFGLTWEPDRPRPGEAPNPDGGSWSLWWRTLPPLVAIPDSEITEGLTDDDIDNNPMYRPVRLASNLRWCKWEAVRSGETISQFTSTWWEDLPAYVTLEIQTVSGKWSKWMFEVQGTRGAEPGTASGGTQTQPPAEEAAAEADPPQGNNNRNRGGRGNR